MSDKSGNVKVLIFIDCMGGFAMATAGFAMATFLTLGDIDVRTIADAALTAFFGAVGLPRLVIFDANSLFAGVFKQLFQLLRNPVDAVSRENHKAARNERFYRYCNKVQRIKEFIYMNLLSRALNIMCNSRIPLATANDELLW
jgi:hypothetical protein